MGEELALRIIGAPHARGTNGTPLVWLDCPRCGRVAWLAVIATDAVSDCATCILTKGEANA